MWPICVRESLSLFLLSTFHPFRYRILSSSVFFSLSFSSLFSSRCAWMVFILRAKVYSRNYFSEHKDNISSMGFSSGMHKSFTIYIHMRDMLCFRLIKQVLWTLTSRQRDRSISILGKQRPTIYIISHDSPTLLKLCVRPSRLRFSSKAHQLSLIGNVNRNQYEINSTYSLNVLELLLNTHLIKSRVNSLLSLSIHFFFFSFSKILTILLFVSKFISFRIV